MKQTKIRTETKKEFEERCICYASKDKVFVYKNHIEKSMEGMIPEDILTLQEFKNKLKSLEE